jgi:tetratricopeptide (TPR) repeat protein
MKDHYLVLGVAPTASLREIKKAYVALALRHNPDLSTEPPTDEGRKRYREIQTAYWILSDRRFRERFDRRLMGRATRGPSDDIADWTQAAAAVPPSERVELEREFSKAEAAFARGAHWEAAGILHKLVERLPGEAAWQRLYAQAAAKCGAFDRARKACEVAIVAAPDLAENHFTLGEVLAEQGDFGGAARECRRALLLRPDHEPSRKLLEKSTTLRNLLFRQRVTLPLYVAAVLGLIALVVVLVIGHLRAG